MEKMSVKQYFKTMLSGLWQAVKWMAGIFGYKDESGFGVWVRRVFAGSVTVIAFCVAIAALTIVGYGLYDFYEQKTRHWNDYGYDRYDEYVSRNVAFCWEADAKGFVFDRNTRKKLIKDISWIAQPMGDDSLVCYAIGDKRGYFNQYTGEVVIEPKYRHAWIFSDGLAGVEENGVVKFIDDTGKVVIDKGFAYNPDMDGYVFHGGYCLIYTKNLNQCGLIDKTGEYVLPQEYDDICPTNDFELWKVEKGKEMAVYDKYMNPVIPFMECSIYIDEGTIDVTMPDHTMRKYDLQGALINDFYIGGYRILEYEKDEILYRQYKTQNYEYDGDCDEYEPDGVKMQYESYHPLATARLRSYIAGDGYEGLITADGHIVTMPLYRDIQAIGYDLYLCTSTNYDKLIVNGKGEIVR